MLNMHAFMGRLRDWTKKGLLNRENNSQGHRSNSGSMRALLPSQRGIESHAQKEVHGWHSIQYSYRTEDRSKHTVRQQETVSHPLCHPSTDTERLVTLSLFLEYGFIDFDLEGEGFVYDRELTQVRPLMVPRHASPKTSPLRWTGPIGNPRNVISISGLCRSRSLRAFSERSSSCAHSQVVPQMGLNSLRLHPREPSTSWTSRYMPTVICPSPWLGTLLSSKSPSPRESESFTEFNVLIDMTWDGMAIRTRRSGATSLLAWHKTMCGVPAICHNQ